MKKLFSGLALTLILSMLISQLSVSVSAAKGTEPVNPDASPEARELLQTLYNLKGRGMITGMYNWHAVPEERTEMLKGITGKYAGIWNSDFGYDGTPQQSADVRRNLINTAKRRAESGEIISLMWHAVKPSDPEAAGWGSVQGSYTDTEFDELLTEGTYLHQQWLNRIDEVAEYLKELRDEGIPVLWRPYHEANGPWFWWCKNGSERYVSLWRQMYDRYTNYHHLDNLLWLWGCDRSTTPVMFSFYPGNAYVDVLGIDMYDDSYPQSFYDSLVKIANGKPIGISECGVLPDIEYIKKNQPDYCYIIEWADYISNNSQSNNYIKNVFNNPYCFNRGEIPTDLEDVDGPGILPDHDPSEFLEIYVTGKGSDFIAFEWVDFEPQAAGYKILWENDQVIAETGRTPGIGGHVTISESMVSGGMQPDTSYTFKVQPYGDASTNWTWLPNTRTITAKTLPPTDAYIYSVNTTEDSFTISLANVGASAKNHIIVYNTDKGDQIVVNKDFTGSYTVVDRLEKVTNYRFVITSLDGAFKPLEGVSLTTGIKADSVTSSSVTLKWEDFYPNKVFYKVKYVDVEGKEQLKDIYGLQATITGLSPDTSYEFEIWGVDSGWNWREKRSITVKTKPLLSLQDGTVYINTDRPEALTDYTLIVSNYNQNRLKSVELLKPAAAVNYTVTPCDKTSAFLWNLETMRPF